MESLWIFLASITSVLPIGEAAITKMYLAWEVDFTIASLITFFNGFETLYITWKALWFENYSSQGVILWSDLEAKWFLNFVRCYSVCNV